MSVREENIKRYKRAAHAVQSGIAMLLSRGSDIATPKHLRVGIDTCKAEQSAIATLLIKKGIFTEDEYFEALADGMEKEVAFQEQAISDQLGIKVHLA